MGAFKAECKLSTSDEVFTISFFKTEFKRETNRVGKTVTDIGAIKAEVRTPSSVSTAILEAMVTCSHSLFDMEITSFASDSTGKQKTWKFTDCYMIGFSDNYNSDSEDEQSTWFQITSNQLECGPAQVISNWVNT